MARERKGELGIFRLHGSDMELSLERFLEVALLCRG
jgi:hypothetical protein